ncbi:hypothetical protein FACS1894111_00360 [Clostridia bacterium]|nr:hypothetical protein FACS1894111_00360 [Clostridia bacterium]
MQKQVLDSSNHFKDSQKADKNLEAPIALSIGGGMEQLPFIKAAVEKGWNVIAVDQDENAVGMKSATESYPINIVNQEEVIDLATRKQVQFVLPSPIGRYLTTVGAVNTALGLNGVSLEQAEISVDKVRYNTFLKAHTIACANQICVRGKEAIRSAIHEIGFPCILKPRFGSGSRGVVVVTDAATCELCVQEHMFGVGGEGDSLIESLLSGEEHGLDVLFVSGKPYIMALRKKYITPLPYRQELGYISVSHEGNQVLHRMLEKLAKAFGVNNAVMHMDLFFSEEGQSVTVIESSFRSSGYAITERMLDHILGTSAISFIMEAIFTGCMPELPKKEPVVYGLFFPNLQGSVISEIKPFPSSANILGNTLTIRPGDEITIIRNGTDAMGHGYVLLRGENEAEVLQLYQEIIDCYVCT